MNVLASSPEDKANGMMYALLGYGPCNLFLIMNPLKANKVGIIVLTGVWSLILKEVSQVPRPQCDEGFNRQLAVDVPGLLILSNLLCGVDVIQTTNN